jgi:peroxiredoxin
MHRLPCLGLAVILMCLAAAARNSAQAQEPAAMKIPAPELQGIEEWINSKPVQLQDLRGRVVVVHFWTFGCINCIHNYTSYSAWHKDFADKGVTIIGVHTPETDGEKKLDAVRKKVKSNKMTYPIAADTDGKTWAAWGNRWWPSIYLIDKKGNVRYRWDGELNWDKVKGERIMRAKIEELLAEKD